MNICMEVTVLIFIVILIFQFPIQREMTISVCIPVDVANTIFIQKTKSGDWNPCWKVKGLTTRHLSSG